MEIEVYRWLKNKSFLLIKLIIKKFWLFEK